MAVIVGYLGTDTATQAAIRYFNCTTAAELPTTGYNLGNGDFGYAQDTDSIYAWDGSAWDQFVPLSATGVAGQVAFFTGINTIGGDAGLTYDSTANKLSISDSSTHLTPLEELFQASTGDVGTRWTLTAANSYIAGIDNSDSDKWKVSYGSAGNAALGTNDYLVIDTSGKVGVGTSPSSLSATFQISRTSSDASGVTCGFFKSRSGGSLNAFDTIGAFQYNGLNSASAEIGFAGVYGFCEDATAGSEDGYIDLQMYVAGTNRTLLRLRNASGVQVDPNVIGYPLDCKSWINNGSATDANSRGDLASGLTGSHKLFFDQSAADLAEISIEANCKLELDCYADAGGFSPIFFFIRRNAAATATSAGMEPGKFSWAGLNSGGSFYEAAKVTSSIGTNTANGYPSTMELYTNNGDGTGLLKHLAITSLGAVNLGSATDGATRGDLSSGLTGAARLFYDQSAATLALYDSASNVNDRLSAVAGTATAFNLNFVDKDFIVHGDTMSNALILDAGTDTWTFSSRVAYLALTPSTITGNQNNYNPEGAGTRYSVWRLATDASRNITGIVPNADGRRLLIVNVGANNLVLQNLNGGSSAANQIITGTGVDVTLAASDTAELWYDPTTANWRIINTY